MSTTLQDLVNRAVFYSTEMQTHFGSVIAGAEWDVDFGSDPHLTFTANDDTVLRTRPHLLGSESTPSGAARGTWLWGWENINGFPEPVVSLSHEVRRFGATEAVDELTTAELELDDELELRLTLAAKEATGRWTHYPAAAGAGTTVWLLIDAPELALPTPRVKTSIRALMQGLTQTTVTDHRIALDHYAAKRGIPSVPLDDGGLRLLFADGCADLSFDEASRIANCEMHTPLEGEAAEQFARLSSTTAAPVSAPATTVGSGTEDASPVPSTSARTAAKPEGRSDGDSEATPAAAESPAGGSQPTPVPSVDETSPAAEALARTEESTSARTEESVAAGDDTTTEAAERERAEHDAAPTSEAESSTSEVEAPEVEPSSPAPARADEDTTKKPKKKGLFSKLFGR